MKTLLTLLLLMITVSAEVTFSGGFKYLYDTNIGQNTTEESGSYIVPTVGVQYDFKEIPLYLSTDFVYDFYVTERDYDDNSPFWEVAVGTKFDFDRLRYSQKLFYELYLGNDLYDSEGEVQNWVPVFQTVSIDNSFRYKINRSEIDLKTVLSYHGYGSDESNNATITFEKEGYYLLLAPKLEQNWSVKEKRVALKSISGEFLYERSFLDHDVDSYNYWRVKVAADIKLFYPRLKLAVTYGEKHHVGSEQHDHTGDYVAIEKQYFSFAPKVEIPLVSDLSFVIGGKLRIKESNAPEHNYDRNTLFAELKWN